jgi:glycosyltransferase involved in cell wall biosynthesis
MISVVLASYNGEKYIKQQLLSLLACLDAHDEIIVSDDNSRDSTRTVVESVNDSRVKLLPKGPRLGYQKNFERAILASKGQIILFSDQDDICLSDRIEISLHLLDTASVVAGDAQVVDANLMPIAQSYFERREICDFSPLSLFAKPRIIGATMGARREFLEYAMPFPINIPHDQWISIIAAMRGELIVSSKKFIQYRRHENVVTHWGGRGRPIRTILSERICLFFLLILKLLSSKSLLKLEW